jgi:hypothetical protein
MRESRSGVARLVATMKFANLALSWPTELPQIPRVWLILRRANSFPKS